MANPSATLSDKFAGHLRYLEFTRRKMESLLATRSIVNRDINQVYAGLYLDVFTSFEQLIEDLFLGLLSGRLSSRSALVVPSITFRNSNLVREIVYGGRRYVDWLPYDRTEQLADRFFHQGRPFSSLNNVEKRQIRDCYYIRNAIAHNSEHSMRVFRQEVIGNQNLLPRERNPIGYLRSVFRAAPRQRRYEILIFNLALIVRKLCN